MMKTLFLYKFRMLRNYVKRIVFLEKSGFLFVVFLQIFFVWLITRFLLADPDFLLKTINTMGVGVLDQIFAILLHFIFLILLGVSILQEIDFLFNNPEPQFLVEFPGVGNLLFFSHLFFSTARILVTLSLLLPLFFVYGYVFYFTLPFSQFLFFPPLAMFVSLLICLVFGSVILACSNIAAWLLTRFKKKTLFLIFGAGFLLITADLATPLMRGKEASSFLEALFILPQKYPGVVGKLIFSSPVTLFTSCFGLFHAGNSTLFLSNFLKALTGLAFAIMMGFLTMKYLILKDFGNVREMAIQQQTEQKSCGYWGPLTLFSPITRGILYEESIFLWRRFSLHACFFALPIALLPLFVPAAAVTIMFPKPIPGFAYFAATLIFLFVDLPPIDLSEKPSFLHLTRTFPVNLSHVFFIKAMLFALICFFFQSVHLSAWLIRGFISFEAGLIALFYLFIFSFIFCFSSIGMVSGTLASVSSQPGNRKSRGLPTMVSFVSVISSSILIGCILLPIKFELNWLLPLVFLFWTILASFQFFLGTRMLAKTEI